MGEANGAEVEDEPKRRGAVEWLLWIWAQIYSRSTPRSSPSHREGREGGGGRAPGLYADGESRACRCHPRGRR